ncbi:outer membrane beta-barrel protein [Hymenobacter antarcticus]
MKHAFLFLVMAIGAPLLQFPCQAQEAKAALQNRYYVGLQTFMGSYEMFYRTTPRLLGIKPWQVVAGAHLTRRWAVQVGYTTSNRSSIEDPSYTGTTLSGQYVSGRRGSDSREQAAVLLMRYSLIRRPHPRLQVDVLAGLTLVSSRFSVYGADFVDGQTVREYYSGDHATQFYATAGLGARYPFGKHFEGVFDYTLSRNLKSVPAGLHQQVSGSSLGLTRAFGLGLRYRFALHKKEVTPASL